MHSSLDLDIDLFSPDAVIMFITLLKPLGNVKRVTSNIKKLFGFNSEEVMNKNCNIIMPRDMARHHDRFLDWFTENDRISTIKKGSVLNFALRSNGLIFTVSNRLRIDNYEDDFGVSGFMTEIYKSNDYIIINSNNQITEMSDRLYNYCFERFFKLNCSFNYIFIIYFL